MVKQAGLITVVLVALLGCKSEGDGFSFVEEPIDSLDGQLAEPPQIVAFTPENDVVRMVDGQAQTFAVTVNSGAGPAVKYEFELANAALATGANPFYLLSGNLAPAGTSEFVIKASNPLGTATKTFVIQKNRKPLVGSTTPAAVGNTVTCGGGSITYNVSASDPDNDNMSFTWKLNGSSIVSGFSVTSTQTTSQNVFSPSCAFSGLVSVTVEIDDGYEKTIATWTTEVVNPSVAQIIAYSPAVDPIIITSTGSQDFSVSATGKSPLVYQWRLDGTPIPGATNALLTLTAASLSVGNHTVEAVVSDPDSSDSRTFNVKRNAPPVISNPSPNLSSLKINAASIRTFSVDVNDANGDSLTYTWRLNGSTNASLSGSSTGTGTQAIFSPNTDLLGTHTIEVIASDGVETASRSWTVQVNLFSEACNNLAAGQICTLIGSPGLGSGLMPASQGDRIKVYPSDIEEDELGNLFIADHLSDVVWYYNRSGSAVNRLGQSVPAGQIRVVVGNGGEGTTSLPGSSGTNYQLFNPYGIAWDPTESRLFVSSYNAHRVLTVRSDGSVQHDLCSGSTANDNARHPFNGAASDHACRFPTGLAWDNTSKALYVAALDQHYIKRFDLSDPDPANWTGRLVLGRQNAGGAVSGGGEDGDMAPGTAGAIARTNQPWGLQVDDNGLVHFVEHVGCRLRVFNPTGVARTFSGVGVTVNPNKVVSIRGNYNGCNFDAGASGRLHRPRGLGLWKSGGEVLGWFISMDTYHRVAFVNNTVSAVTLGDRIVASGHGEVIWGTGGAGYGGESGPARTNQINQAFLAKPSRDGTTLWLADTVNHMVRSLAINVANGSIGLVVGGGSKTGSLIGTSISADRVQMDRPTFLAFDSTANALLYSDSSNAAIRSVSLATGVSSNLIGGTSGPGDTEQVSPSAAELRTPTGLLKFGSGLLYADAQSGTGGNRNCQVRALNTSLSTLDFWSVFVNSNRISTVAGNYVDGCNTVTGLDGMATGARLFAPSGLATNGTDLYIANTGDHCILKVAPNGTITRHLGSCGTQGHSESALATSDSNLLRLPTDVFADPAYPGSGNLFIVDQTNQATSRIKYVNMTGSAVTVSGVSIPANSIRTLYNTGGYSVGVTAFQDQICYTSGSPTNGSQGAHHVICTNRGDALQNTTMRAGAIQGATISAGSQMFNEHEGVAAPTALLYGPYGLAFDAEGNLYISEHSNHVIRMVKRWW